MQTVPNPELAAQIRNKLLTIVGLGSIGTIITVVGYCFFPTSILQ